MSYPQVSVAGIEKRVHIVAAEGALGHKLPLGAEVHHADEDIGNSANTNLVICEDRAYHNLLHKRRRALLACGNANYRPCTHCKKFDNPDFMGFNKSNGCSTHRACAALLQRERRARLGETYNAHKRELYRKKKERAND